MSHSKTTCDWLAPVLSAKQKSGLKKIDVRKSLSTTLEFSLDFFSYTGPGGILSGCIRHKISDDNYVASLLHSVALQLVYVIAEGIMITIWSLR